MFPTRAATATVAVLTASALCAGCATTVKGTALRAKHTGAGAAQTGALSAVLPTEQELSDAVGNPLSLNGFPPREGGLELLPDGIRTDADASPIECLGPTSALMRLNYEHSPVRATATANFWNYGSEVTASSANVGAVRLASADDAEALFETFTRQWRDCQGQTVIQRTHDSSGTELSSRVEDVEVSGSVLSATIMASDNHHTPEFPNERAIGVKSNVIVEADVAVTKPRARAQERAIAVVKLMLDKIPDVG